MGQLDCRGSTSRQINCPFMNWVPPPEMLSDCSMLWVGTLNVPVRLNIGAKNVFWVEVAAKQRGGGGFAEATTQESITAGISSMVPLTRCSILRFESGCGHHSPTFTLHTSLTLEELKKTAQAAFSSYQKSKWRQQQEHFKHEHSKCVLFQFIFHS